MNALPHSHPGRIQMLGMTHCNSLMAAALIEKKVSRGAAHLVGELCIRRGSVQQSRQAKVSQLQGAVRGQQQIVRLHVTVHDAVAVGVAAETARSDQKKRIGRQPDVGAQLMHTRSILIHEGCVEGVERG